MEGMKIGMRTQKKIEVETEIVNAQIEATRLGPGGNDGRGFGCWLFLKYEGGCGQGFGGYSLTKPDKRRDDDDYEDRWLGTAWGMSYITRLLEAVGVDEWEKLKGKYVRVKREAGWNGQILGVGHIIDDKWFEPNNDLKEYFNEDGTIR